MNVDEIINAIIERYNSPDCRIVIKGSSEEADVTGIEIAHVKDVVARVRESFGNYDALLLAAAGHDWDRAFPQRRIPFDQKDYWRYKICHSFNSASIFKENFSGHLDDRLMGDTTYLITRHEIGGKRDGSLIYTSDSFSGTFNLEEAADHLQSADSLSGLVSLDSSPHFEVRGIEYARKKIKMAYLRLPEGERKKVEAVKFSRVLMRELLRELRDEPPEFSREELETIYNETAKDYPGL